MINGLNLVQFYFYIVYLFVSIYKFDIFPYLYDQLNALNLWIGCGNTYLRLPYMRRLLKLAQILVNSVPWYAANIECVWNKLSGIWILFFDSNVFSNARVLSS